MQHGIGYIWNGFHYKWRRNPHRFSRLGSRFENLNFSDHQSTVYHRFFTRIGNWPQDTADYAVPYVRVESEKVYFGHGSVRFELTSHYNKPEYFKHSFSVPVANLHASFPLAELDPLSLKNFTVLMNGFEILPQNNVSGWHFGGLALEIEDARLTKEGMLTFTVSSFINPSSPPEKFVHGNKEWNDPPAPLCIHDIEMDFLLVVGSPENVNFEAHTTDFGEIKTGKSHFKYEFDRSLMPSNQIITAGMNGFSFYLKHKNGKEKRPGRYIREFGAFISHLQNGDRPESATSNFVFSNNGKMGFKWSSQGQKKVTLLRLCHDSTRLSFGEITGVIDREHPEEIKKILPHESTKEVKAILNTSVIS